MIRSYSQCYDKNLQSILGIAFMILSGKEIKRKLGRDIIIDPFNDRQLGPNSYNLRLHDELDDV